MRALLTGCLLAALSTQAQTDKDDPLLRAMKDEMARSAKLSISDLETPYYVEYTLEDATFFSASASLGALLSTSKNRARIPRVQVRVGNYEFDNTNYIYSDLLSGSRYDPGRFPLDNDYLEHRHAWWLATDRAYKGAVEAIARKRAALKNVTQNESLPDLWKSQPVQKIDSPVQAPDLDGWLDRVRSLSSLFAYPEILESNVHFGGSHATFYMLNSEGTVLRRPEPLFHLQALAVAQAPDGSTVRDSISIPRIRVSALPDDAALKATLSGVAENVRALAKAPAGETYTGPVLFEGLAGAQIVAEVLAPNLLSGRRPVSEPGRNAPYLPGEFDGRVGSRVLPDFLDLVDDPTQKTWNGQELLGHLEVDEEGVAAKPLTLVEKGTLKTFLLTRQPVKGFDASNGRARMPGLYGARTASVSNLFVRSSASVKGPELKAQMLKLLSDRNKPWGIIIRKMDFPSAATGEELRRLAMAASQSGAVRVISTPVLAYKVYPDGREELVRGLRFRGLNARAFRDILAASEETYALHYLNKLAPMALLTAGGYVSTVSVISPSLLFEELELEHPQEELPKLPVVPPPPLMSAAKK